jgi:subtilase family serine protease
VHSVVLGVPLRANAAADCDAELLAVSTPGAPRYRQYLSFEQAGQRFRNLPAERRLLAFLAKHGISRAEVCSKHQPSLF